MPFPSRKTLQCSVLAGNHSTVDFEPEKTHKAMVINTGGTFGDNTPPSNFDPIGLARRQPVQHFWIHCCEEAQSVCRFLPPVSLADPPVTSEIATFASADANPAR